MKNILKRCDRPGAPPTGEFVKYDDYAKLEILYDEMLVNLKNTDNTIQAATAEAHINMETAAVAYIKLLLKRRAL